MDEFRLELHFFLTIFNTVKGSLNVVFYAVVFWNEEAKSSHLF